MKRTTMILVGCLAIGIGENTAMAQNNPANSRVGADNDNQKQGQDQNRASEMAPKASHLAHASQVLDMSVRDPQGKEIGSVEDIIIDTQGRVALVILSFEDDFVSNDKLYAVPPQALRQGNDPSRQTLILNTTKDKFTETNGFSDDNYPKFDEKSTRETYQRFNQSPYWEGNMDDRNRDQTNRDGQRSQPDQQRRNRDNDARDNQEESRDNARENREDSNVARDNAQGSRDSRPNVRDNEQDNRDERDNARDNRDDSNVARDNAQGNRKSRPNVRDDEQENRDNRDNLTPAQRDAQEANRDPNSPEAQKSDAERRRAYNQAPQFDRQNGWTCRASDIIGKEVMSNNNEDLGSIKDLVVDVSEYRVLYAVLSDGGTLNLNETFTPVPYSALKAAGQEEQFTLNATEDSLKAISFQESAWPDMSNKQWAQRVHKQFNQDPYWAVSTHNGAQRNSVDKHWRSDSTYNKSYDTQRPKTIKGMVTSVSEFSPENGAEKGRQIMLRSDDGTTSNVHLGPSSYMKQQDSSFAVKEGDVLTVTGSTCEFKGKDVLMASKIRNNTDGKTQELRDDNGKPKWDKHDKQDRQDNQDQDNQARNNERASGQTDPDYRSQPSSNQPKP